MSRGWGNCAHPIGWKPPLTSVISHKESGYPRLGFFVQCNLPSPMSHAREHRRVYQVRGPRTLDPPQFPLCRSSDIVTRPVSRAGRRKYAASWDRPILPVNHHVRDVGERAKNVSSPRCGQGKSPIGNHNLLTESPGLNLPLFLPILSFCRLAIQILEKKIIDYCQEMDVRQLLCLGVTPEPTMKH